MNEYIDPFDRTALTKIRQGADDLLREASSYPCENEEQKAWWSALMSAAHGEWKELEKQRRELTDPIVSAQKRVNQAFRLPMCSLECVKDLCKEKLSSYAQRVEGRRADVLALVAEAASEGDSTAIAKAVAALPEDQGGSWEWVPFVEDASAVPDAYKIVDMKMLKAYAKTFNRLDTIPSIPGISFTREPIVRAKCV